jgi:hypothetical protein
MDLNLDLDLNGNLEIDATLDLDVNLDLDADRRVGGFLVPRLVCPADVTRFLPFLSGVLAGFVLVGAALPVSASPRKSEKSEHHHHSRGAKLGHDDKATGEEPKHRHQHASKSDEDDDEHHAKGPRSARLGLGTNRVAGLLLSGRPEPRWVREAGSETAMPGTLRFPVKKGWFVRGFGSGAGGYHQAMDIGGTVGWPVYAAASGLVAYASDGINGYGNMVMIIHPGGWVTTYAHNSKLRVKPGQKVRAGAVIAELGSTGRSHGPHVHFELLYAGQNCDPGPLFRPGVAHKNGKRVDIPRVVWRSASKRPRDITCHSRKHHPDYDRGEPRPPEDSEDDDEGRDDTP